MTEPVKPTPETIVVSGINPSAHSMLTAVLCALVLVLGAAIFFGARSYERQITKADADYKVLQRQTAKDNAVIKQDTSQRTIQTAAIQMAQKNTDDRDHKAELLKAEVSVANATDADVHGLSQKYLHVDGLKAPSGVFTFSYSKADVQGFVATKIDDATVTQDKADLEVKDATITNELTTAEQDLTLCQADEAETNKVLVQYKKAAHKSKWRKALDITEKVGLFAGGVYLGRLSVKH